MEKYKSLYEAFKYPIWAILFILVFIVLCVFVFPVFLIGLAVLLSPFS